MNQPTMFDPIKLKKNRLRRALRREGLSLVKSRTRNDEAYDYGCYMIVDPYMNAVVAGAETGRPGFSLDDVHEWLQEYLPSATA